MSKQWFNKKFTQFCWPIKNFSQSQRKLLISLLFKVVIFVIILARVYFDPNVTKNVEIKILFYIHHQHILHISDCSMN